MRLDFLKKQDLPYKLMKWSIMGLSLTLIHACSENKTTREERAAPEPSREVVVQKQSYQLEFEEALNKVKEKALKQGLDLESIKMVGFFIVNTNPQIKDHSTASTLRVQIMPTTNKGTLSVVIISPDNTVQHLIAQQVMEDGKATEKYSTDSSSFPLIMYTNNGRMITAGSVVRPLKVSSPAAASFKKLSTTDEYAKAMKNSKAIDPWKP